MHEHAQQYRSALGRVRGLGAAHHGTHHWWMQRVSSVALILLGLWLLYSLMHIHSFTREMIVEWLACPLHAILMVATVWTGLYHSFLGLQVIAEDYLHNRITRTVLMVGLRITFFLTACTALIVIIKILGHHA